MKGSVFRVSKVGFKFQNVLTNNGDVYNPDNGVITIPETGVWALTISAEVSTGFDGLSVGKPHIHPRIWIFLKEDTSSSLIFRNLSYGDRLFWYSSYNETLTATRSSISGWLIGPIKCLLAKDSLNTQNKFAYASCYKVIFHNLIFRKNR